MSVSKEMIEALNSLPIAVGEVNDSPYTLLYLQGLSDYTMTVRDGYLTVANKGQTLLNEEAVGSLLSDESIQALSLLPLPYNTAQSGERAKVYELALSQNIAKLEEWGVEGNRAVRLYLTPLGQAIVDKCMVGDMPSIEQQAQQKYPALFKNRATSTVILATGEQTGVVVESRTDSGDYDPIGTFYTQWIPFTDTDTWQPYEGSIIITPSECEKWQNH